MIRRFFSVAAIAIFTLSIPANAETHWADTPFGKLPSQVYYQKGKHHVQGVAVDVKNKCIYFSFTTSLIKTDFEGNLIGSVEGLSCHLGCLDLDTETGKLYGSMEYKDDVIGQGISGQAATTRGNTFYIAIFDTKNITRPDMNPTDGNVLKAVYLKEVVDMYEGKTTNNNKEYDHVYGCSGIDGISLGPQFGKKDGKKVLNVALGIYGDVERTDNDYQVLLQYDPAKLEKWAKPLASFHKSGPKKAGKYIFAFTGNTNWGVQNLEYDPYTQYWFMGVYNGKKTIWPNYSLYAFDGNKATKKEYLKGFIPAKKGWTITMADDGLKDGKTAIRGWNAKADTGIESIGKGYFYISQNGRTKDKIQYCKLGLFKWTGNPERPFEEVK